MAASGVTLDVNDYSCMKVSLVKRYILSISCRFIFHKRFFLCVCVTIWMFFVDRGTSSLTKSDGNTWRTWQTLLWPWRSLSWTSTISRSITSCYALVRVNVMCSCAFVSPLLSKLNETRLPPLPQLFGPKRMDKLPMCGLLESSWFVFQQILTALQVWIKAEC